MIRPATQHDTTAIVDLVVVTGMFLPDQVAPIKAILNDVHAGNLGTEHYIAVKTDAANIPIGAVYFSADAMAERKWDLWMIAVAPNQQRQGIGRALIHYTETQIKKNQGRLLLIDTSSQAKYLPTQAFYKTIGYKEVARIPDFYAKNEDKIVFSKHL